eukprot:SM000106S13937  [mRNA]  locus=s106:12715:16334:- [translate_table: standard]
MGRAVTAVVVTALLAACLAAGPVVDAKTHKHPVSLPAPPPPEAVPEYALSAFERMPHVEAAPSLEARAYTYGPNIKKLGLVAPYILNQATLALNGSLYRYASVNPPLAVDWRTRNVLTAVRDQGVCSSCWAHSSVDSVAAIWAIAKSRVVSWWVSEARVAGCDDRSGGGEAARGMRVWSTLPRRGPRDAVLLGPRLQSALRRSVRPDGDAFANSTLCLGLWPLVQNVAPPNLSAQQVCDCEQGSCCQGGWPEWALQYVVENGGVQTTAAYPYVAANQTCRATNQPNGASITSWDAVPQRDAVALAKAVANQPVIVFIEASAPDFQNYTGGVYDGSCTSNLNHAVLVVGYGLDAASGKNYWLIKNSWGPAWGEGGYMRLAMYDGKGLCGITSSPALVSPRPGCTRRRSSWRESGHHGGSPVVMQPLRAPQSARRPLVPRARPLRLLPCFPVITDSVNGCNNLPNPCGTGQCVPLNTAGGYSCKCASGFVPNFATSSGQPQCVPSNPCSANPNPCGSGSCTNNGDGSYSCACPGNYIVGAKSDGSATCVFGHGSGTQTYTTIFGDTCPPDRRPRFRLSRRPDGLSPSIPRICSLSKLRTRSASRSSRASTPASSATRRTSALRISTPVSNAHPFLDERRSQRPSCPPRTLATARLHIASSSESSTWVVVSRRPEPLDAGSAVSVSSDGVTNGCATSYTVQSGDTCLNILVKTWVWPWVLLSYNPTLNCNQLFAGQQLCLSKQTIVKPPPKCGQVYEVQPYQDTCAWVVQNYGLDYPTLYSLNPGLQCTPYHLPARMSICVAADTGPVLNTLVPQVLLPNCSKVRSSVARVRAPRARDEMRVCFDAPRAGRPTDSLPPRTYRVQVGDSCPTIYMAANLTETQFMGLNPGLQCDSPRLQIGQPLCIAPPVSTDYINYMPYVIKRNDTLQSIAQSVASQCGPTASPANICWQNNLPDCNNLTSVVNTTIEREARGPPALLSLAEFYSVLLFPPSVRRPGAVHEPEGTAGAPALTVCLARSRSLGPQIPCQWPVGRYCGCTPDVPVCGWDGKIYTSQCDAICNYASPTYAPTGGKCNPCAVGCAGSCFGAPSILSPSYCQLSSYWNPCPNPVWPPTTYSCTDYLVECQKCCWGLGYGSFEFNSCFSSCRNGKC